MTEQQERPPQYQRPLYFTVSPFKLVVMSVVTLGMYEVYWFYRNWKLVKERENSDIKPFWRSVFAILFCHCLLKSIKESATSHGVPVAFGTGTLGLTWVLLTLCGALPNPFWLISYFAIAALLPVQKAVNELNRSVAPDHDSNVRFTGLNIAGVVVGGICFILIVINACITE